jgi:DNA primase
LGIEGAYQSGYEIWARCPHHNDRKGKWSINNEPGGEHWGLCSCFVCREREKIPRNVVALTAHILDKSYQKAMEWLETFAGIEHSEDAAYSLELLRRRKRGVSVHGNQDNEEEPARLYARMRPLQPDSPGYYYLIGRGVTPEQIAARGVREGADRYSGRVVFPIYSGSVVVNIYARSFGSKNPKGLYAKKKGTISTTLFGLEQANKLLDTCYLSEGAFDVLTIERLIKPHRKELSRNNVATDGPILHEEQAKLLRHFKTIIVVPDMEGKAKSLVPTALKYLSNHILMIVEPPRGSDIDDWGRRDPEVATRALLNPVNLRRKKVSLRVNYSIRL